MDPVQPIQNNSTTTIPFHTHDGVNSPLIDGVNTEDFVKTDGSRDFTGDQSMGGNKLTDVEDPTSDQDAATKNYVDDNKSYVISKISSGSVSSTTDETNIFSVSIPANTLGTGGTLVARVWVSQIKSATGNNVTLKAYYDNAGNSMVATLNNNAMIGYIDFYIIADGATNDQQMKFRVDFTQSGFDSAGSAQSWVEQDDIDMAVDSTGARDMKVTVQFAASNAGDIISWTGGIVYVIKG